MSDLSHVFADECGRPRFRGPVQSRVQVGVLHLVGRPCFGYAQPSSIKASPKRIAKPIPSDERRETCSSTAKASTPEGLGIVGRRAIFTATAQIRPIRDGPARRESR